MLADYHMHTSFSDDSDYPMEEAVKRALSLGFDELCFTEHVDYGVKTDENCDYNAYQAEFLRCKELFKDKIQLKFGIEFGIQTHTIAEFERDFKGYPFDFVIMSCHQVEDKEFWRMEFQEGRTQEEYNRRYYEEILQVISRYKNYSVLGHLDMIVRYDPIGVYPFEKVEPIIRQILKTAIKDGKGIEVNTSSFRYGVKDLTPSVNILRLYKELGGTILTIGSDSHKESHVGYNIPLVKERLRGLGFKNFCTFTKMQPAFHAL